MDLMLRSYYGCGSGVVDELIGNPVSCCVCGEDENLILIGQVLYCLAQKQDFHVKFIEELEVM